MSPAGFRHLHDAEIAQLARLRVVRASFEAPDGSRFERDVVRNQPVVAMVPVADDGTVWLVRQYRGPIDRELLEIPAGLCDVEGEAPEATAVRENSTSVDARPCSSIWRGTRKRDAMSIFSSGV